MREFNVRPVLGSLSMALLALASACSAGGLGGVPASGISVAPSVFVPIPTSTASPILEPTLTSTSTPLAAPFVPFTVVPWADNVLLRTNPGYLFGKLATLDKGASLLVLGRSPGGEWLLVKTADNHAGWVFTQLIDLQGNDPTQAPFIMPASVQQVTGTVKDEQGQPISGIQFALTQGAGTSAPRTDAMTDSTGTFYAFMPVDASGEWSVGYTAVACTSNTMDAKCNCTNGVCGRPYPESINITLPLKQGDALSFVWK